jgi:hypothetical protein
MQLRARPPCSARPRAKLDAACWGPAGVSVGWMQRLMQLADGLQGPRWLGCSLESATSRRPEVRHDLDEASGATALFGPAPCQVGCSLPGACRALGGLDATWKSPHPHGPRSGTTWMQLRVRPPCSARPRAKLDAAPARPSVGWMQLAVLLTTTARRQARAGCSFGCDRPARPGPMPSWMHLAGCNSIAALGRCCFRASLMSEYTR